MAEKLIPFYNVDQSVGKGGVNSPDDVQLVQFFLTEVGKVPPLNLIQTVQDRFGQNSIVMTKSNSSLRG